MSEASQNDHDTAQPRPDATAAGNYFVANYPPFSAWSAETLPAATQRLALAPEKPPPFGLYVHIPFCRKRCDFCYFRVYTDNDSARVHRYVDALVAELRLLAATPYLRDRPPEFVYFGGGTPSYLSVDQLRSLFEQLRALMPWDAVREVTFECEPGTLQERKVHALAELGVTRLSLGVESFDAELLALNNRAHRAAEIDRAYGWAGEAGFDQRNLDLIAGMVGESDEGWTRSVERARALAPESITIYQMEVPYNTTLYRRMRDGGQQVAPVADWPTKRRWVGEAFAALERDGYRIGSAYTAVRGDEVHFRYRDALWHGADMLGIGVASFSHLGGFHVQNAHHLDDYLQAVEAGAFPLRRALQLTDEERMIREFVLQLKLGRVETRPFVDKFGVDPQQRFAGVLRDYQSRGHLELEEGAVVLTRQGLLQVDPLLQGFFLDRHRNARYA